MLYILFRYFCFDNIGDMFTGLFIKDNIATNSNGGGNYIIILITSDKRLIFYKKLCAFYNDK